MADFVPFIDVSRWQGSIEWAKAAPGVSGVWIRAGHADVPDSTFKGNVTGARAVGLKVGAYQFVNPKRASASEHARAIDRWMREVGGCDIPAHADVEWYAAEPGDGPVLTKPQMNAWLVDYLNMVELLTGRKPVIYSSHAFWDQYVGPIPNQKAYDFILARYPVSSPDGYKRYPVPRDPAKWAEWAFARAPAGPRLPAGSDDWEAWQFSAGYNGMGPPLGMDSSDLDLNIARADAWARWTNGDGAVAEAQQQFSLVALEGDPAVWALSADRQGRVHIPSPAVLAVDQALLTAAGLNANVTVLPADWREWLESHPITGKSSITQDQIDAIVSSTVAGVSAAIREALEGIDPATIEAAVAAAVASLAARVSSCLAT